MNGIFFCLSEHHKLTSQFKLFFALPQKCPITALEHIDNDIDLFSVLTISKLLKKRRRVRLFEAENYVENFERRQFIKIQSYNFHRSNKCLPHTRSRSEQHLNVANHIPA